MITKAEAVAVALDAAQAADVAEYPREIERLVLGQLDKMRILSAWDGYSNEHGGRFTRRKLNGEVVGEVWSSSSGYWSASLPRQQHLTFRAAAAAAGFVDRRLRTQGWLFLPNNRGELATSQYTNWRNNVCFSPGDLVELTPPQRMQDHELGTLAPGLATWGVVTYPDELCRYPAIRLSDQRRVWVRARPSRLLFLRVAASWSYKVAQMVGPYGLD